MTFYAVSGGAWSRRPAAIDTLWRLQNVQETLGPWSLKEVEFYVTWRWEISHYYNYRYMGIIWEI